MERNQRLLNRYALDEEDTIYVLGLSYGKDSLACLGAIEKLGLPLHRIVHKEVWATQTIPADLPPMVEFKAKADEIIYQRYGIKVEHICATKNGGRRSYEDVFYQERKPHKNGGQYQRYGFPMQKGNWCTSLLKTDVKVSKDTSKKQVSYLGIAADEPIRIKRHEGKKELMLPLVEIGWDEEYCGLWCKYNDLLSPIYTNATRGGCWFCHNQGVEQLRQLRKRYPDLWKKLLEWDLDSEVSFKPDGHTVHDYDARFQMEDDGIIDASEPWYWRYLDQVQLRIQGI